MTRMAYSLLLLLCFGVQSLADQPFSAVPNSVDGIGFQFKESVANKSVVPAALHTTSCVLSGTLDEDDLAIEKPVVDYDLRYTCPWEACYFIDESIESSETVVEEASVDFRPWSLISSIGTSPAWQSVKPAAVNCLESAYRFLTWTGEIVPDQVSPVVAYSPEPTVPLPPIFDVEKAILDSWKELATGPVIIEPKYVSKMDSYWMYYSDCDRWNVVFADAITGQRMLAQRESVSPEAKIAGQYWENVRSGYVLHIVERIQTAGAVIEFQMVENAFPVQFRQPLFELKGGSAWIQQNLRLGQLVQNISNDLECHIAGNEHTWWRQVADRLVSDFADLRLEHEKQMVRTYMAPRINWLSEKLGEVARNMEDEPVDVAQEDTNMK